MQPWLAYGGPALHFRGLSGRRAASKSGSRIHAWRQPVGYSHSPSLMSYRGGLPGYKQRSGSRTRQGKALKAAVGNVTGSLPMQFNSYQADHQVHSRLHPKVAWLRSAANSAHDNSTASAMQNTRSSSTLVVDRAARVWLDTHLSEVVPTILAKSSPCGRMLSPRLQLCGLPRRAAGRRFRRM